MSALTEWMNRVRALLGLQPGARLPHELQRRLESLGLQRVSEEQAADELKRLMAS